MNNKGYKIMNISDGEDNIYGKICIVEANPINSNGLYLTHSISIDKDTETFLFIDDENILNQLIKILQGDGIWYPYENDFNTEQVYDNERGLIKNVYRHNSFYSTDYDKSLNSGKRICLIPDLEYKIRILNNQYYNNNWFNIYSDFKDYVISLAEGYDVNNFWGWLFGKDEFNNLMPWELPCEYEKEYNRFIDKCKQYENNDFIF